MTIETTHTKRMLSARSCPHQNNGAPLEFPYLSDVSLNRPTSKLSRGQRRSRRKKALLDAFPRCARCGRRLTETPNCEDTAVLIRQSLSCQSCRDQVSAMERAKLCMKEVDGTKQHSSHGLRLIRRAELMSIDPHCAGCGWRLTTQTGQPNTANLVGNLLSCPKCLDRVQIARA